jgi:hypothetical protein
MLSVLLNIQKFKFISKQPNSELGLYLTKQVEQYDIREKF